MRVEEESEKAVLKLNIQKTNIMASGPITSWQINGKQWKQHILGWPKRSITAYGKIQQTFWLTKQLNVVMISEVVKDFLFLGSKIAADSYYCSYEIKRCLLLGRKVMTNLDGILKGRPNMET